MHPHPSPWDHTPITSLALATTGTDPTTAQVCGYALTTHTDQGATTHHGLVKTPEPIPAAATAVHGITTEDAAWGATPDAAMNVITSTLLGAPGVIAAQNAAWVFATLNLWAQAHSLAPFTPTAPLLDPLVLDKAIGGRACQGRRTLAGLCEQWHVPAPQWRSPRFTAPAVPQLTRTLVTVTPKFRRQSPDQLGESCRQWYYEAEAEFETYLQSKGKEPDVFWDWPVAPEPMAADPDNPPF